MVLVVISFLFCLVVLVFYNVAFCMNGLNWLRFGAYAIILLFCLWVCSLLFCLVCPSLVCCLLGIIW